MELYVFAISHYSERARWALAYAHQPVTLRLLTPGLHIATMRSLRAKGTHVPLLRVGSEHVQGSDRILTWLAEQVGFGELEPDPHQREEAQVLENRIDRDIGQHLRTVLYDALLTHEPKLVREMWSRGQPAWHRVALAATWPMLCSRVGAIYGCTPAGVRAAKIAFEACWDALEARLVDQPYLLGDRFTRVDLTAAALLAPLVQPTTHPFAWSPTPPPSLSTFSSRYVDRPLADWVRRIYAAHRHTR